MFKDSACTQPGPSAKEQGINTFFCCFNESKQKKVRNQDPEKPPNAMETFWTEVQLVQAVTAALHIPVQASPPHPLT